MIGDAKSSGVIEGGEIECLHSGGSEDVHLDDIGSEEWGEGTSVATTRSE